jgi:hypothetical protein
MNQKGPPRNLLSATDYLLYGVTIFGWSTSWIAIHMQLGIAAPEVSLVWRFGLASAVMFLWAFLTKVQITFPLRAHLQFQALGLFPFQRQLPQFLLWWAVHPRGAAGARLL